MRNGSPALFVSASVTLRNQFVFFCVVICRGLRQLRVEHCPIEDSAQREAQQSAEIQKVEIDLRHRRASKTMVSGIDCGLICFCVFG